MKWDASEGFEVEAGAAALEPAPKKTPSKAAAKPALTRPHTPKLHTAAYAFNFTIEFM